jgi:hypothetical protein
VSIDYHDGLRWPWLERAAPGTAPTGLDILLAQADDALAPWFREREHGGRSASGSLRRASSCS